MEIPEGYANVRWVYSVSGVAKEMSFAIGVAPPTAASASEIAELADQAWAGAGQGGATSMQQGWTYLGTRVIKTFAGTPSAGEFTLSVAGTATGETIPPNCAILVRKNTALGGRKQRGRIYLPPYRGQDADVSNAGLIGSMTQGILQTAFNTLVTQLNGLDLVPTLFHSDPLDPPTTITSFSVQSLLATQRRRLR